MKARTYLAIIAVQFTLVLTFIVRANSTLFSSRTLISELSNQDFNVWLPSRFQFPKQGDALEIFRGNSHREGVVNLNEFPRTLRSAWLTDPINVGVHSAAKSSPIVFNDKVFVGSDTGWFYAFNISGELLWRTYFAESQRGIHGTAATDGESLFIGSYGGAIYCLDGNTGHVNWTRALGSALGASPLLLENSLIVNVEEAYPAGYLFKVDRSSGEIIWKSENLNEQSHSSPALDEKSNTIIVGVNDSSIQGFDFNTGKRKWRLAISGAAKTTPVISNGFAYLANSKNELTAVEVATGKLIWKAELESPSRTSAIVLKNSNLVVVADEKANVYAFHRDSGVKKWSLKFNFKSAFISSPVLISAAKVEKILIGCDEQTLCLISDFGHVDKRWPLQGHLTATPYVTANSIYLSYDEGGVERLNFLQ